MAVPLAYTEQELADFMHDELQDVASDLSMSPVALGSYVEAINNALLAYGVATITGITGLENIGRLRAIARVQAWKVAQARAAARYDMSDGTQSLKRSQMMTNIAKGLASAESDARAVGGGSAPVVSISPVRYSQDPYGPPPGVVRRS